MYHMIIEQTYQHQKRMKYDSATNTFDETKYDSLFYVRKIKQPYGWIEESGTPPEPHWDVILMSNGNFGLGDRIEINLIGVFMRNDGDHKFIAVKTDRDIFDYSELTDNEKQDLYRLYPNADKDEGWFGKDKAMEIATSLSLQSNT